MDGDCCIRCYFFLFLVVRYWIWEKGMFNQTIILSYSLFSQFASSSIHWGTIFNVFISDDHSYKYYRFRCFRTLLLFVVYHVKLKRNPCLYSASGHRVVLLL
ncbi:hypothetical protein HDV64DRAFT_213580 [Trichoderma sp. TUCIM 5745]